MSVASVTAFLAEKAPDISIVRLQTSTATVALAAEGHGVQPAQIAKTLCIRAGEQAMLIVTCGTARLDNRKLKALFGTKAKMPGAAEVEALTSHPVGGVCPFGLPLPMPVYCDISLKAFGEVIPAAGDPHSAVRISPARLAELAAAQ
jgi:prolyl-tRNA editing enzyme YbaK/EbsC (Cys-tRNA(Pro) deacylase)